MSGVVLGTAICGMRPILVHMRVDFAVLAMECVVNQAAKWHFMYGGKMRAPITVRMIIGRGWGQGPQHSQSLQAWFATLIATGKPGARYSPMRGWSSEVNIGLAVTRSSATTSAKVR